MSKKEDEKKSLYLLHIAMGKISTKDYQGALESLNLAVKLFDKHEEIYVFRAIANNYLGNYVETVKDSEKVKKMFPDNVNGYMFCAIANYSLQNYTKAIKDYTILIDRDDSPSNVYKFYHRRGTSYFLLKKYDNAKKDLEKSLELNPGDTIIDEESRTYLEIINKM